MERKEMSIRAFAELCRVSHTEIRRKMTDLGIKGNGGGRGKPTLLSVADQDRIAQKLFVSDDGEIESAPSNTFQGELAPYTPTPLRTYFQQKADERFRREIRSKAAVNQFNQNRDALRQALIGFAREDGVNLGDEMAEAKLNAAMSQYEYRQVLAGKALGVIPEAPAVSPDGSNGSAGRSQ